MCVSSLRRYLLPWQVDLSHVFHKSSRAKEFLNTRKKKVKSEPFSIFFVFVNPFVPIGFDLRFVELFILQQKVPSLLFGFDEMKLAHARARMRLN